MRTLLATIFLSILIASPSTAATYYVRADGTAATKATATDPTVASTSMSLATFNAETFAAGDTVYFSSRGGVFTGAVTLPSGGSDTNNRIVYSGEPGYRPSFTHYLGFIVQVSYVDVVDITHNGAAESNFLFQGASVGIRTYNLIAANATNQCLQHLNTVQVDHYNISTSGASDEGLSMHDSPTVNVYGGTISGYSGINWVDTGTLELYDCTVLSENGSGYVLQPSATTYNFKAHRCVFMQAAGSTKRLIDFYGAGSVEFVNCAFKNLGETDYFLLLRSTLTYARLLNCTFYSGSITGAVVFNQVSTGEYKNNLFHTTTTGSGKAYYSNSGVDNTSYYQSGTTYNGTVYTTTDPLLVDPANNDFHLQSTSPSIGQGADLSSYFTDDIDGDVRGISWDIGVDQYVVSAATGAALLLGL